MFNDSRWRSFSAACLIDQPPIPVVTNLNCIEEQEQRSNAAKCERRGNESKRNERNFFSHAPALGITCRSPVPFYS